MNRIRNIIQLAVIKAKTMGLMFRNAQNHKTHLIELEDDWFKLTPEPPIQTSTNFANEPGKTISDSDPR